MPQVSKAELLERLTRESARLKDTFERLDPDVRVGAWSLTEFLAHLIAHEQRAMAEVRAALVGEHFEIDHDANDAFNQGATFSSRAFPSDAVYRAWLESNASLLGFVESLPDDVFRAPNAVIQTLGDTIDGALANNTYGHYAEHLPKLIGLIKV